MSCPQLHIRLLGPLEVLNEDERLELPPSRKARALLAYLVATGRAHARTALCDMFWQDVKDPRAGLRWALSKLRPVVDDGDYRIAATRNRVEFIRSDAVIDLQSVRAAIADDLNETSVTTLEEAVAAFRGEFLEGLDLPTCHRYDAWCMGMRVRVQRLHVRIRRTLTVRFRDDEEPNRALPHALAWVHADPYSEEAYVAAIHLLGKIGRTKEGLELYNRCRRMLSDELQASPSEELETARRCLENAAGVVSPQHTRVERDWAELPDARGRGIATVLSELPPPQGLSEPGLDDPSLVGRHEEMEMLARFIRGAHETSRNVLAITGEPGIGKTRLLREMLRDVRAQGGWVLGGPVFESETIRPFGPWIDMMRSLPGAALGNDGGRDVSALLYDPRYRPPVEAPAERGELYEGVARLLERLVLSRSPGFIAIDDVQWLDASSAALLHYLARTLQALPLAFAIAAREEDIEEGSPQARLLRSLREERLVQTISLRRLDASETASLVRDVTAAADTDWIFATSEGNPFFALAVAESLQDGEVRTPPSIEGELFDRLDRLESGARSLLPWAAALGQAFDVATLVEVVDRPTHEIVEAIDRLERRGILRASASDRYDFSHSLLRRAAYRRLSAPARRAVHRSIALALDGPARAQNRFHGAVAHHAELGGLPALAARAYSEAAEYSLWLFALDEAVELVRRGLSQVENLPDEYRIALEMNLLRLYGFRSIRDRRPADVEDRVRRVTEEARQSGFNEVVAIGHATLTELEYQRGAFEEAAESSVRSAEAGRESEPATAVRALAKTGSCLLLLDQAPEDARRLTREAVILSEKYELKMDVVALAQALLCHHDGKLDDASRAFETVVRLGRKARDRWWESPVLTRMIMVELDRGDFERAASRAREAEALAERLGDETEAVFARGLGAVATARDRQQSNEESFEDDAVMKAVDGALQELRTLDSLWSIGHVQAYAAELELERGNSDAARQRAEEVVSAAHTLGRPSLLAVGISLLAQSMAQGGYSAQAARHLDAQVVSRADHHLSHRARRALRRARKTVA